MERGRQSGAFGAGGTVRTAGTYEVSFYPHVGVTVLPRIIRRAVLVPRPVSHAVYGLAHLAMFGSRVDILMNIVI